MHTDPPSEQDIQKVKNQAESTVVFSEVDLLNQAMNLAFFANEGRPEEVNLEESKIASVSRAGILQAIKSTLTPDNCTTLLYRSTQ